VTTIAFYIFLVLVTGFYTWFCVSFIPERRSRQEAALRLRDLMTLGDHWIQLDVDKAVLGPFWMN
jgi:hypothetical protein